MSNVRPTVKDVSRAVAHLNETYRPLVPTSVATDDAIARVASNFAYQFARHNGWGGRKNVTTRDVRAALIVHGADPLVADKTARRIAGTIRADFTDGAAPQAWQAAAAAVAEQNNAPAGDAA